MSLLPTILKKAVSFAQHELAAEKTFRSFDEAVGACRNDSYLSGDIAQIVSAKTKLLRVALEGHAVTLTPTAIPALTGILYVLYAGNEKSITILDFGGSCGAHYFQLTSILPDSIDIKWAVVETPPMVNAARAFESDSLRFFSSIGEAKTWLGQKIDIVHSSGALQYVPHPNQTLRELVDIGARFLLLTRMNMTEGDADIVFVQKSMLSDNGPGPMPPGFSNREVRYPNTGFRKRLFESTIIQSYRTLVVFEDPLTAKTVGRHPLVGHGVFCIKRE